jgi:hypothetical protein
MPIAMYIKVKQLMIQLGNWSSLTASWGEQTRRAMGNDGERTTTIRYESYCSVRFYCIF